MPILPEDREKYKQFIINRLIDLDSVTYPPETTVWHYTTGAGLLGIIESGAIYATHVACLNDSTEIRYAVKLYYDALESVRQKSAGDPEAIKFLTRVLEINLDDPKLPRHGSSPYFVACFSNLEDDLPQWRAYSESGGENGYAIGFHARALYDPIGGLLRVNYDTEKHKAMAARTAEAALQFFRDGLRDKRATTVEQWEEEFIREWSEVTSRLAPVVKDACFETENEFRLVHGLDASELPRIKFRQKDTLLSRHLPLSFQDFPRLPIAKVTIGPGRQQHVSRISVHALLTQKGYRNVPVEISQRPLQRT